LIQGVADMCDPPSESDRQERFFTGYRRTMLDKTGHFPAREAPHEVASEILSHLKVFA
jgi:pimeloyl-ACP methyl ester carboxylesterase